VKGKAYLVGAGPGDPDLLTVKALRLLQNAEAVLYDDLVDPAILRIIPRTALIQNVGKRCGRKSIQQEEINFLMTALAESGVDVIRLKSGDPLMFGRAGEEIEALRKEGVAYEIVPGVTSALGAAAAAGIPLTHRRASSAVVFMTAHQAGGKLSEEWKKLAASGSTLVLYMPGQDYAEVSSRLRTAGLANDTPCAIVSHATTPQQQIHRTTIGELGDVPTLASPTLLVVGEVVRFADEGIMDELDTQNLPVVELNLAENHTSFRES
jgi:uroporphyrin-III C-methyltransferase